MIRYGKTNNWTAEAIAAASKPIDSRMQLQLRPFEPSPAKPAAWHSWASQSASDAPDFIVPRKTYWS